MRYTRLLLSLYVSKTNSSSFFFSSRRRHTRFKCDWSSDVCSSDLEDLKMPHIATWWCGQKSAREEVLSRLDDFANEGAYGRGVPGFDAHGPVLAAELSASERERLKTAIANRGIDYVGQELVRLSTTPVWDNGSIAPRPFVLRVFAAATPNGWTVMPGGFCRIAEQLDARAVSMGDGARAADV